MNRPADGFTVLHWLAGSRSNASEPTQAKKIMAVNNEIC